MAHKEIFICDKCETIIEENNRGLPIVFKVAIRIVSQTKETNFSVNDNFSYREICFTCATRISELLKLSKESTTLNNELFQDFNLTKSPNDEE